MNNTIAAPTSLAGAIKYFADKDVAMTFLAGMRWPSGVACPHCQTADPMFLKSRKIWKCRKCRKQFSVKVGTIFEDSAIGLDKWLPALWMLANCKNGISSYELGRALGVTQKTAWFMLHRIRLAMQAKSYTKFKGEVEVDETYVGGKARFMHGERKARMMRGRRGGSFSKAAVMGVLQRDTRKGMSQIRLEHVGLSPIVRADAHSFVHDNIEPFATLYTDEHRAYSYAQMRRTFVHKVVHHAKAYAYGRIHINGLESFWSLMKRTIRGTYVSVEPFHLHRYLDEQVHRFNNRKTKDVVRFINTVIGILGKRLTYNQLIGAATT